MSCFSREGMLDPATEVIPRWIRIVSFLYPCMTGCTHNKTNANLHCITPSQAAATSNHISLSKFCINAMDLVKSPHHTEEYTALHPNAIGAANGPGKAKRAELKRQICQAKDLEKLAELFGIGKEELEGWRNGNVEDLVPAWVEKVRKADEVEEGGGGHIDVRSDERHCGLRESGGQVEVGEAGPLLEEKDGLSRPKAITEIVDPDRVVERACSFPVPSFVENPSQVVAV